MIPVDKNKTYPKETEASAIIRFQDCDPLGHLNNAKYFDYFFNAREDQLLTLYGYRPGDLYKTFKCSWVVYNHNISYVRSVVYGERVKIMSRVIYFDKNTVVVEYYMTDEEKKELKTLMWTTLKYINVETGKLTSHQQEVVGFLNIMKVENVDYLHLTIKARIKEIKNSLQI